MFHILSFPCFIVSLYYIFFQGKDYRTQFQLGNGALLGASYIQVWDLYTFCSIFFSNKIVVKDLFILGKYTDMVLVLFSCLNEYVGDMPVIIKFQVAYWVYFWA